MKHCEGHRCAQRFVAKMIVRGHVNRKDKGWKKDVEAIFKRPNKMASALM
jgi:hypothetical protein